MKISEAFDAYGRYMVLKGRSQRCIEHNDYVKRMMVETLGDIKLKRLTLKDVSEWKKAMTIGELPNGKKIKRADNSLRCDMLAVRVMLKYMDLIVFLQLFLIKQLLKIFLYLILIFFHYF